MGGRGSSSGSVAGAIRKQKSIISGLETEIREVKDVIEHNVQRVTKSKGKFQGDLERKVLEKRFNYRGLITQRTQAKKTLNLLERIQKSNKP